jgi:hypothetical protein
MTKTTEKDSRDPRQSFEREFDSQTEYVLTGPFRYRLHRRSEKGGRGNTSVCVVVWSRYGASLAVTAPFRSVVLSYAATPG